VEELPWPDDVNQWFRRVARLPGALFLDSARFHRRLGRYSYLAADPFETIRSRAGQARVEASDKKTSDKKTPAPFFRGSGKGVGCLFREACDGPQRQDALDPFAALAERLARYAIEPVRGLPPFQGGAAGLFAYDLCHHLERLPRAKHDEFQTPDMVVGLYDCVVALDLAERRAWAISTGLPGPVPGRRHDRAAERMAWLRAVLLTDSDTRCDAIERLHATSDARDRCVPADRFPLHGHAGIASNFTPHGYVRAIQRAIDYIHAGDVYQVNLAHRLLAVLGESPVELYLRLRRCNPATFGGYFDAGDCVIASASPERFLRVDQGCVETRPIKGTRPRWSGPEADMYSAGELRESGKDRAENVMIVDLLRNDLGRVCEYGSIHVADPLQLESFEFVHHLVSEVRGRLRPGLGPVDLLRAAFPGGSVTGAPKIRAMQIIAELEPTARGPYCGSLGFIGFDGSMDTNILIRTFTCARGWVQFPVGGGIVAESSPDREYEETLHKAEGMIRALSAATASV
jgi:para-aminobenzoate synthetase component 1